MANGWLPCIICDGEGRIVTGTRIEKSTGAVMEYFEECDECHGTGIHPQIIRTRTAYGYNNVTLEGLCSPSVTTEDLKRELAHYATFGFRTVEINDGQWRVVYSID